MKKVFTTLLLVALPLAGLEARAPKYIFIMFGDGMGINHISLTEDYDAYKAGLHYGGRRLNFREFPYFGLCDTPSASSSVTGSSEAATALFCGQKTNLGYVGVDTEGKPLESVMSKFHKKGYLVGILSSDPINAATPAAVYAHNKSRGDFKGITRDLPSSDFEFFAGYSFADFNNVDGNLDADDYLAAQGYPTYYGIGEFKSRDRSLRHAILVHQKCRVKKSSLTAEMDKNKQYTLEMDTPEVTPAQMLDCCLEMFGEKKPFIILCEEGEIDHASHMNFPMEVVNGIHRLESAVDRALAFYRKHPNQTLIVVVSDHETGGLSYGKDKHWVDWKTLEDDWNSNKPKDEYRQKESLALSKECNVMWSTRHHTGSPTPIFAIGCGAKKYNGAMDNTDFSKILLGL